MKKRILVSAAGTAAAWHLASLASGPFTSYFELFLCDTNPPHLIASSKLAHGFFQVPAIDDPAYHSHMLALFAENKIDIFVPLIDTDIHLFPIDSPELAKVAVRSTGVLSETSAIMADKRTLSGFLESRGFRVPRILADEEAALRAGDRFFVKPAKGFGSKSARAVYTEDIPRVVHQEPGLLIQELCGNPEITVEVFNRDGVVSLCRERLETKAGVCTKARIFFDSTLQLLAERLCSALSLPVAFCFQLMTGSDGTLLITDINPRLGAGTAMSTAYGWSLASAALVCYGDLPLDPRQFLRTTPGDRYVVRVYKEELMDLSY